ncbi:MAG: hypothetical protein QOG43_2375 [Actinomycetota bacterium]|jgi:MYXO-CTERM domain-containing protein|nr:hypothetical protein [Actinomycetota bacterium]
MTRRHRGAIAAGVGLVGVYLVAALATMALSDHPFRPLFDGLAPPVAYHWVNPPRANARDNVAPSAASRDVPLAVDGSPFVNVTPDDAQAIVLLEPRAVAPRPPDTALTVAVTPLDVLALGRLPRDMTPQSNAYQVTITYQPSGEPVTEVTVDTSSIAVVASGPSDFLLFSRDGQSWAKRQTTPLGLGHGLETRFAGPGYYVVTSISGASSGGASPLVVVVVLLAPVLVVGGLVLRRRRAQAAAAAKAAKRRAQPRKGGQKSKRRSR